MGRDAGRRRGEMATGKKRAAGEGRKRIKEKKRREREKKIERRGKRRKGGGGRLFSRKGKTMRGWLQKRRGWEQKKAGTGLGFWRLGGLWAGWATLSPFLKTFLFCKINLAINFRKRRRLSR